MSVAGGVPFWKAIGLAAAMPLDCELEKEVLRSILVCSGTNQHTSNADEAR